VNLTAGEPELETPPHIRSAAIEAIQKGYTRYTPADGIIELKLAIVQKLKNENNLSYQPSQILVSSGAKNAIYNILQVISEKDDQILIPSPYWTSYPQIVKTTPAKPHIIPLEESTEFKLTPQILKDHITSKTKALILNTPSNPTGLLYTRQELMKLIEPILDSRIYVISDEVYEKLVYDAEHVSIASLGEEIKSHTILVNSLSKIYAMTGWRVGYAAGPEEVIELAKRLQSHSISCPCSISQYAALEALGPEQSFIPKLVQTYKKKRDLMVNLLSSIEELSFLKPQGAFYIFVKILRILQRMKIPSSTAFAEELLEKNALAVVPGAAFGNDNYIRLSFCVPDDDIIEGVRRLKEFVKG
jgi:aspartate aminotransferase